MQQIIVYRNPLEAYFWNSMANGGALIFLAVICLGILWVLSVIVLENIKKRFTKKRSWGAGKFEMIIASIITLAAAYFLHTLSI